MSEPKWYVSDAGYLKKGSITLADLRYSQTTSETKSLIAAAPELLEACKRAKKLLEPEVTKEPDRTIFWELVEAIRKAEGRS